MAEPKNYWPELKILVKNMLGREFTFKEADSLISFLGKVQVETVELCKEEVLSTTGDKK